MRIGLDARGLNTRFVRGMGEYIEKLIVEVGRRHEVEWYCYGNRPDQPFHRPEGSTISRATLTDTPGNRFHAWEQLTLPYQAKRDKVDVLHCTMTTMPWWQPVPTVVTIHDTVQWNTDEDMGPGFYRDRLLPSAFARCAAIVTISHSSQRDILRHWPHLRDKVHVVHHGIVDTYLTDDVGPAPTMLHGLGIDRPYLLYAGGDAPRKRLAWTIELFRELGRTDIVLAVLGVAEAAHAALRASLPEEIRANVVLLPFVPEEDMPALYRNALLTLYPTLYEGFGLPAVKAQAVGTPILLSAVSSLLELAGPAAVLLEPDDKAGWLDSCRATIERRMAALVPDAASRQWSRQFDLENTSEAHWRIYQQAARHG